jgi:hypothetical protein
MLHSLVLALSLQAAPQGHSLHVATIEEAPKAVVKAVEEVLTHEGYALRESGAEYDISGAVSGGVVGLKLVRTSDGRIIEDAREAVTEKVDAAEAARRATRQLTQELRLTTGVRARVKP